MKYVNVILMDSVSFKDTWLIGLVMEKVFCIYCMLFSLLYTTSGITRTSCAWCLQPGCCHPPLEVLATGLLGNPGCPLPESFAKYKPKKVILSFI